MVLLSFRVACRDSTGPSSGRPHPPAALGRGAGERRPPARRTGTRRSRGSTSFVTTMRRGGSQTLLRPLGAAFTTGTPVGNDSETRGVPPAGSGPRTPSADGDPEPRPFGSNGRYPLDTISGFGDFSWPDIIGLSAEGE